ncbi:hypothetical protein CSOJ01_05383 [Colletotrichum sojae]|uniref:Uncharacterized protein n=1 Tax=Colletotrichum sojae TaxID=2175907 RepID=A0A8H6JF41_9PEZI|nr:hypothetical protein CSOJ01_05383 [Colletotrichum sojae]
MRVSTLAAGFASVAALLSISVGVAASNVAGHGRQDKPPAPGLQPKHQARSPQDPNVFVSYDYGYSYPPPPPPTTYGESESTSTTGDGSCPNIRFSSQPRCPTNTL